MHTIRSTVQLTQCLDQNHATVRHANDRARARDEGVSRRSSAIRQRLRTWEAENPSPAENLLIPGDDSASNPGLMVNTRMGGLDGARFDEDAQEQAFFHGDGLMDLRSDASRLQAGDLLEIR